MKEDILAIENLLNTLKEDLKGLWTRRHRDSVARGSWCKGIGWSSNTKPKGTDLNYIWRIGESNKKKKEALETIVLDLNSNTTQMNR